jgi:hypothetical protein
MAKAKVGIGAFVFFLTAGCQPAEPTASCGINFCLPDGLTFADVQAYNGTFIYVALPGDGTGIIIAETNEQDWPLGGGPVAKSANGMPLPLAINKDARLIPSTIQGDVPGAAVEMHFLGSPSPHVRLTGFCESSSSCVVADFAKNLRPR